MSQGVLLKSLIFHLDLELTQWMCIFSLVCVFYFYICVFPLCPREVVIDFYIWLVYCLCIIGRGSFLRKYLAPLWTVALFLFRHCCFFFLIVPITDLLPQNGFLRKTDIENLIFAYSKLYMCTIFCITLEWHSQGAETGNLVPNQQSTSDDDPCIFSQLGIRSPSSILGCRRRRRSSFPVEKKALLKELRYREVCPLVACLSQDWE